MSAASFLPEQSSSAAVAVDTSVGSGLPKATDSDFALAGRLVAALVARPQQLLGPLMSYIVDAIQVSNLVIPISQIVGTQNLVDDTTAAALAARHVGIATAEGEVSVTSTSLDTFSGAPAITSLDDGTWAVVFGAAANGDDAASGSSVLLAARTNGASDSATAESQIQGLYSSIARGVTTTLSAGDGANSIALVAKTTIAGHTSKVREAWILAIKIA